MSTSKVKHENDSKRKSNQCDRCVEIIEKVVKNVTRIDEYG